jgi:hypothetical protein
MSQFRGTLSKPTSVLDILSFKFFTEFDRQGKATAAWERMILVLVARD